MRYKSFKIIAEVIDDEGYTGFPSLGYIEVTSPVISTTKPKSTSSMHVIIPEDHPMFNFDIWADVIDFIVDPETSGNFDNYHQFMGSDAVNYNIAKYFPQVMRYYQYQI